MVSKYMENANDIHTSLCPYKSSFFSFLLLNTEIKISIAVRTDGPEYEQLLGFCA